MKSVMTRDFSQIPEVEIRRSSFNRSHGKKMTIDADTLYPFFVDEVLPGDSISLNATLFGRLNTPLYAPMDNIHLETFYFWIPMRQIWDNSKKFFGEQINPGDSIDYTIPIIASDATGYGEQSIYDYFELPTKLTRSYNHSALPLRCYYKVWDEWFRDENIQNSLTFDTDDGPDLHSDYTLQKRGKRHDYFTSCLPSPQKGTGISLPLGTSADIAADLHYDGVDDAINRPTILDPGTTDYYPMENASYSHGASATGNAGQKLYADLTNATAATVIQLREALQLQVLLETDARSGTRYFESVYAHFGVDMPHELYRSEFLGGGSEMVNINPVPSQNDLGTTGKIGSFGTVSGSGHGFTKSFVEHGYVIGLVNMRADLTYQQGMDKMWSRSTRYDFYYPELAHIGEDAVLTKEIYMDSASAANDDDVFGYQERFAEYKFKNSKLVGLFRSNCTSSLDPWHLSQEFGAVPTLNSSFIESNTPMDRIMTVTTEPDMILDVYFDYQHARPMPVHSVPGLVSHF
jgi:hypothetical protein